MALIALIDSDLSTTMQADPTNIAITHL